MNETKQKIIELIPNLRRYARALMKDKEEADDLVQDTLVRALNKLNLWERESNLRAWIFTIMHNIFINKIKKKQRSGMHYDITNFADQLYHPDSNNGVLELNDCIRSLTALPPSQREVILLITLEGLSYSETSMILGIPIGTVMSRLSRARKHLIISMKGNR